MLLFKEICISTGLELEIKRPLCKKKGLKEGNKNAPSTKTLTRNFVKAQDLHVQTI
jgi:hypothetical protein